MKILSPPVTAAVNFRIVRPEFRMRLAAYIRRLSAFAQTVHRWLALAARLDSLSREKVALYNEEIAATLRISLATVKRYLLKAAAQCFFAMTLE